MLVVRVLNLGFSISLIAYSILPVLHNIIPMVLPSIQLKTAAGGPLPIIDYIQTRVCIVDMESSVEQNFVVVSSLIAPSIRDCYPLHLPDKVQDCLAGSKFFTILDLHSGYWQLPVAPADREKTAFCPSPGMGLYQFSRMPLGLFGAPGSFQRLMDSNYYADFHLC